MAGYEANGDVKGDGGTHELDTHGFQRFTHLDDLDRMRHVHRGERRCARECHASHRPGLWPLLLLLRCECGMRGGRRHVSKVVPEGVAEHTTRVKGRANFQATRARGTRDGG